MNTTTPMFEAYCKLNPFIVRFVGPYPDKSGLNHVRFKTEEERQAWVARNIELNAVAVMEEV